MRVWLLVVLMLPFALAGCPTLLSDWTIRGNGAVDASVDATGTEAAKGSSGSGTGDSGASSGSSDGSLGSSGGSGGAAGTDGGPKARGVSTTGGTSAGDMASTGGATNTGGAVSMGGTTSTGGKAGAAPVCESLQGPTALSQTNVGGGIVFHSKVNATLVKFVFHNGGIADTVSLQDGVSCSVIASVQVPASVQMYTASVSWPLVANKSYRLVNMLSGYYNAAQAIVSTWPWTDGQNLSVDSAAVTNGCGTRNDYWFNFTDLEICE